MGDCRPSSGQHDLNIKKKLHLGPDAQGALNSELVKSILNRIKIEKIQTQLFWIL